MTTRPRQVPCQVLRRKKSFQVSLREHQALEAKVLKAMLEVQPKTIEGVLAKFNWLRKATNPHLTGRWQTVSMRREFVKKRTSIDYRGATYFLCSHVETLDRDSTLFCRCLD